MKILGQIAGKGGADYYAAGTYVVDAETTPLLRPIHSVEWAGVDCTISAITDSDGLVHDTNFNYIDNEIAITTDFGLMTFGFDVYGITASAAFKCWYVN